MQPRNSIPGAARSGRLVLAGSLNRLHHSAPGRNVAVAVGRLSWGPPGTPLPERRWLNERYRAPGPLVPGWGEEKEEEAAAVSVRDALRVPAGGRRGALRRGVCPCAVLACGRQRSAPPARSSRGALIQRASPSRRL